MIHITIDGKEAFVPDDLEFEIKMDNPYFSGTGSHSLEIELPARPNTHIFSLAYRFDALKKEIRYPASVMADGHQVLFGSAVVTSYTDESVKVQLVAGNAELNFLARDDIFLDEVEWEMIHSLTGRMEGYEFITAYHGEEIVSDPDHYIDGRVVPRTFYPFVYMYHLVDLILRKFGYSIGRSVLHTTWMRDILCVCAFKKTVINLGDGDIMTKYGISDTWAGLPHWSVKEFFINLEKFCGVTVYVDEKTRKVDIVPSAEFFSNNVTYITDVIDAYECNMQDEDSGNVTKGNLSFGSSADGYNRLKKEIYLAAKKMSFASEQDMKTFWNGASDEIRKSTLFSWSYHQYITVDGKLKEVNLLEDLVRDWSDDSAVELKITPVNLKYTDVKLHYYGPLQEMLSFKVNMLVPYVREVSSYATAAIKSLQDAIDGKETVTEATKKDSMEVCLCKLLKYQDLSGTSYTCPWTYYDGTQPAAANAVLKIPGSLCLRSTGKNSLGFIHRNITPIDSSVSYKFSFCLNCIPDIRDLFVLHNQKFVAREITIRVNKLGLDPIMEGEFYRID